MRAPEDGQSRISTDRGVSNVLGFTLIIGIIFLSIVAVATIGSAALSDTQQNSEMERAEHTMTLLDSRAAMVALGSSTTQSLNFGQDSGSFEVQPGSGTLSIKHINYTAGKTEEIFNESLGAIVYENGQSEIAYQGGGVWRLDRKGDSRMLSPPEFHYRGSTLTLPVIRVRGTVSSGSSPRTVIRSIGNDRLIFPNETTTSSVGTGAPYDEDNSSYHNPIRNGTVEVQVKSPYYEGWAAYFRQRTAGTIEVFDANETVHLTLGTIGSDPGEFDMPLEGDSLEVPGVGDGHPLREFKITLKIDNHLQTGHWSLYSTDGPNLFEMHIYSEGKCQGGTWSNNKNIDFSIYYYNSTSGESRQWQNSNIDPTDKTSAFDISCSDGELKVDFMNSNTKMTYKDIDLKGTNNKWCFSDHIEDNRAPNNVTLDQHPVDGSTNYTKGDKDRINFTVDHYMSRMPTDFELVVKDGPGNSECLTGKGKGGSSRVDEGQSYGVLRYDQAFGAQYITFLHVTENKVDVDLD